MTMPTLPDDWSETRATMQAYAQALTAIPRAAATPDDHWGHVSMTVTPTGVETAPTRLTNGVELVSSVDLESHQIIIATGEDTDQIEILGGPSSLSIGERVLAVAARHGSDIEVERDRFGTDQPLPYDRGHAESFLAAASYVVRAFERMNADIQGKTVGPHLWPHGFDIATEWYSNKLVPYGEGEAHAQVAVGFYPSNDSYFYANPWPFDDDWATNPPVPGSYWHLEDWQGAVLPPHGADSEGIVAFGSAVHALARDSLSV